MLRTIPILAVGIIFCAVLFAIQADASTFYEWTDDQGVVSVTDDVKRIPARYRDAAVERSFEDVRTASRTTPVTVPAADYSAALERSLARLRDLNGRTTVNPNANRDCTGPMTITKERRNYEERGNSYNSMFFVMRNSCGDEVSVTREQPRVQSVPLH